jgi:hypothetical protein
MSTRSLFAKLFATILLLSGLAQGGSFVVNTGVKAGSTANFTSFRVITDNGPVQVTPPAGWVANRVPRSTRVWEITGGWVPPGGAFSVTLSVPGRTPTGAFIGGDYVDAAGRQIWVTTCPDPLSTIVIAAGATDLNYLGYVVPAGQYGYFYEWWNPENFPDATGRAEIQVGSFAGAYNFQTINNSFPLSDLSAQENLQIDGADSLMTTFMDPSAASGIPGVNTAWSFDATTGIASAIFSPGTGLGLGPGQASQILAFTSPNAPIMTDDFNVSAVYVSDFPCPGGYTYVPDAPEPATWLMISAGLAVLGAHVRRRGRAPRNPLA